MPDRPKTPAPWDSLPGDKDDPNSRISQLLRTEKSFRLKEDAGTKPNVHYIGRYSPRA